MRHIALALCLLTASFTPTFAETPAEPAAALRQIDQRRVFETVLANTTDTRVRDRVNGVFNSGMSFG